MRNYKLIAGVLLLTSGFLSAILIGFGLLVVLECDAVPVAIHRRLGDETRFHALSTMQILQEDALRIGVVDASIAKLKRENRVSLGKSISELERLRSRLLAGYRKEESFITDTFVSRRVYAFSSDKEAGYAHLAWVEDMIGAAVRDNPGPGDPTTSNTERRDNGDASDVE